MSSWNEQNVKRDKNLLKSREILRLVCGRLPKQNNTVALIAKTKHATEQRFVLSCV
jgi:hypothetical protein